MAGYPGGLFEGAVTCVALIDILGGVTCFLLLLSRLLVVPGCGVKQPFYECLKKE